MQKPASKKLATCELVIMLYPRSYGQCHINSVHPRNSCSTRNGVSHYAGDIDEQFHDLPTDSQQLITLS